MKTASQEKKPDWKIPFKLYIVLYINNNYVHNEIGKKYNFKTASSDVHSAGGPCVSFLSLLTYYPLIVNMKELF